jgi:hypothetical protein
MRLNNGSVLVNGRISEMWQNVLFWRAFAVMFFHYLAILLTMSLMLRLGWFSQVVVVTHVDDTISRPDEDSTTMFAFIRQVFYHKTLAYT